MQLSWSNQINIVTKKCGSFVKRYAWGGAKGTSIFLQVFLVYQTVSTIFGYPARINGASMSPTLNAEEQNYKHENSLEKNKTRRKEKGKKEELEINKSKISEAKLQKSSALIEDYQCLFLDNSTLYMFPWINKTAKKEWVFVNTWSMRYTSQQTKNIEAGDIVVFISPKDENDSVIKRVIATEHQIIQTRKDKKGAEHWKAGGGDVIVIPKGHCWVEGDNQETSVDSRRYGPVSNGLIFGKVKWVIYPFHRIRKLTSISPQPSHSESTRVIGSNGIPRTYL